VLINSTAVPGHSNRPAVTADASSHGDNTDTAWPQRRATAPAAATIAATASASSEPPGAGSRGSGSSAHASAVNADRSGPAREANRRSQPRTVATGLPSNCAIGRCPRPAAARASAAPITVAASARRASTPAGNSTCVRPHLAQTARRGRSRQPIPLSPRITRTRACPHPASRPEHPGQASRPSLSRRSTSAPSLPTVSTGVPPRTTTRPSRLRQEITGGPSQYDALTLSPDIKKGNPNQAAHPTLNPDDADLPPGAHTE
jgi:hypothetical protein